VVADGRGLVGHAGAVLLRKLADRVGLASGLAGILPAGTGAGWRDRGVVLVQLVTAIVLGAVNLSEAEQLQAHHQGLFGPEVSDSTTRRALQALDASPREDREGAGPGAPARVVPAGPAAGWIPLAEHRG
jgi:hypothetical protein